MSWNAPNLPADKHRFFDRHGGVSNGRYESLNVNRKSADTPENIRQNINIAAGAFGMTAAAAAFPCQDVTGHAEYTDAPSLHRIEADGLVTDRPGILLGITTADCAPVLFADFKNGVIGAAHAGWRGMAAGILPKTVEVMAEKLGAKRESLIAVLGPSIRQECFETDADVPEAMERLMGERVHPFIAEKGVKYHVDLQGIGVRLLTDAGLSPENVIDSGICTKCCADEFWSHRATHGHRGVQGGIICL